MSAMVFGEMPTPRQPRLPLHELIPDNANSRLCESKYLIYGLIDPRTDLIRYVGQSANGIKRPRQHRTPKQLSANTYKCKWLRQLLRDGLDYRVVILQYSAEESLSSDEIWWIAFGRALGWPLTNATDGGHGTRGYSPTPETREKLREVNKNRTFTPEWRAKISAAGRGRTASPETVDRLRKSHLGKRQSLETLIKRSAAMRGVDQSPDVERSLNAKWTDDLVRMWVKEQLGGRRSPAAKIRMSGGVTPEGRERQRAGAVAYNQRRGPISEETRARLRASHLGKSQSAETIARRVAKLTGQKRTDEQRAVMSERQRANRPTHCPSGHEYTAENMRLRADGSIKGCRRCGIEYERRKRDALKSQDRSS